MKEPSLANASVWAGFGDGALVKLRLLNASLSPPKEPWPWLVPAGDDIPLNDPEGVWETCCAAGWGCGRGAVAYSDRMDCLRSGRD